MFVIIRDEGWYSAVSPMLRVHLVDDVDRILVLPPYQGGNVSGSNFPTKEYGIFVLLLLSYTNKIGKFTKIFKKVNLNYFLILI